MPKQRTEAEEQQHIEQQRDRNAKGGFFYTAAVWLLSRFPLTKHRYQNWTRGRRILVGWLLWLICLPIIPAVAIIVWYLNDPEGFKQSPWAKGLIGLFVVWLGAFGFIATNQVQPDQDGRYSPVQTHQTEQKAKNNKATGSTDDTSQPCVEGQGRDCSHVDGGGRTKHTTKKPADGETKATNNDAAATPSERAKQKVRDLKQSKPTGGKTYENCTAAFEAGVFNIGRTDPSYQAKLDRDGDGIACER